MRDGSVCERDEDRERKGEGVAYMHRKMRKGVTFRIAAYPLLATEGNENCIIVL